MIRKGVHMGKLAIMLEHTRLAREYSELPINAESPEAYEPIARRGEEILARIKELKEMESRWK